MLHGAGKFTTVGIMFWWMLVNVSSTMKHIWDIWSIDIVSTSDLKHICFLDILRWLIYLNCSNFIHSIHTSLQFVTLMSSFIIVYLHLEERICDSITSWCSLHAAWTCKMDPNLSFLSSNFIFRFSTHRTLQCFGMFWSGYWIWIDFSHSPCLTCLVWWFWCNRGQHGITKAPLSLTIDKSNRSLERIPAMRVLLGEQNSWDSLEVKIRLHVCTWTIFY